MLKIFAVFMCIFLGACSYSNLEYVKERSDETWEKAGFSVVGYEGFQLGFTWIHPEYGGAHVWYTVSRDKNGIVYHGFLQRWGNEIHIYNLKAIDAIKP